MNRKLTAIVAMCATSLATVSPAYAAVTLVDPVPAANPDAVVLEGMQATCDAAAALADTDGAGGDEWTAHVQLGDVTLYAGPTEVGSHTFAGNGVGTQTGAGTFTPGHVDFLG